MTANDLHLSRAELSQARVNTIVVVLTFALTLLVQTVVVSVWAGGLTAEVKGLNHNMAQISGRMATGEQLRAETELRETNDAILQQQINEIKAAIK